jgi:cyclohexadieny/prephenate dehydrogenase
MAAPRTVALIGTGLIGGSLGLALRRDGIEVRGFDHDPARAAAAETIGAVDVLAAGVAEAVQGADLTVVAVPVGRVAEVVVEALDAGAVLITDVGSVKSVVVKEVGPHVPQGVHFIPGHPIAGTEQSGPEAGFAELFDGRWCILTPVPGTDAGALARLKEFWQRCGSDVEIMEPKQHDLVLPITSHVPHLIAYNIVGTAADLETVTQSEVIKYSASGFRDFTRIAASDPTMWRDIFLNNREAVLEILGRFNEDLAALQRAVRWGDGDALFNLFTRTRAIRRSIVEAGQDTPAPNFGRSGPGSGRR